MDSPRKRKLLKLEDLKDTRKAKCLALPYPCTNDCRKSVDTTTTEYEDAKKSLDSFENLTTLPYDDGIVVTLRTIALGNMCPKHKNGQDHEITAMDWAYYWIAERYLPYFFRGTQWPPVDRWACLASSEEKPCLTLECSAPKNLTQRKEVYSLFYQLALCVYNTQARASRFELAIKQLVQYWLCTAHTAEENRIVQQWELRLGSRMETSPGKKQHSSCASSARSQDSEDPFTEEATLPGEGQALSSQLSPQEIANKNPVLALDAYTTGHLTVPSGQNHSSPASRLTNRSPTTSDQESESSPALNAQVAKHRRRSGSSVAPMSRKTSGIYKTQSVREDLEYRPYNEKTLPPRAILHKVFAVMKTKLTPADCEGEGHVYTFEINAPANDTSIVKIGRCMKDIEQRERRLSDYGFDVGITSEESFTSVRHSVKVEALVRDAYLHNERLSCRGCCKNESHELRVHKEFFEMDVKTGSQAVELFTSWIRNHRPYDSQGRLKLDWSRRIEKWIRMTTSDKADSGETIASIDSDVKVCLEEFFNFTNAQKWSQWLWCEICGSRPGKGKELRPSYRDLVSESLRRPIAFWFQWLIMLFVCCYVDSHFWQCVFNGGVWLLIPVGYAS